MIRITCKNHKLLKGSTRFCTVLRDRTVISSASVSKGTVGTVEFIDEYKNLFHYYNNPLNANISGESEKNCRLRLAYRNEELKCN